MIGRKSSLQESRQSRRHRRGEAHGATPSPGGSHHRLHVLFEAAVEQSVGFVEDLDDERVGSNRAAVEKLFDATRRADDDATPAGCDGGHLGRLGNATDAQHAWETGGGDVRFGVGEHLRSELAGGEEDDGGGETGRVRRRVAGPGCILRRERVRERKEVRERLARTRGGLHEDVATGDNHRAKRALLNGGEMRDARGFYARLGVL